MCHVIYTDLEALRVAAARAAPPRERRGVLRVLRSRVNINTRGGGVVARRRRRGGADGVRRLLGLVLGRDSYS